jgi:hypothetical protein
MITVGLPWDKALLRLYSLLLFPLIPKFTKNS